MPLPHTRFPVCDGELDEVLGLITTKDILNQMIAGTPLDLKAIMKPPLFVPENMRVVQLARYF